MEKDFLFYFSQIFIFLVFTFSLISAKTSNIIEINEDIPGNTDYKKVSFESDDMTLNHFFKYNVENIPKSGIGSFRIDFDEFNVYSMKNEVFCTFVDESTSDEELQDKLFHLTNEDTSCVGNFNNEGIFDGIIRYDKNRTRLGIYLMAQGAIKFTATVYIRITETFLDIKEQIVDINETYSLIPYIVFIPDFRKSASKILFYSSKRELQMYYEDENSSYPKKLFSGNIMSVYTNPKLVHQKYHDANYMVLLTRDFSKDNVNNSEILKFQIKLFPSNYLLDYYVSNDPNGRSKNSPFVINMTECENPYYVILNYNKPEKEISLYIDQIYGKIKSLSVASNFNSISWDEMINNDMKDIQVTGVKFDLPKESEAHIDVYKIECEIPLLLNFYYVDETKDISKLNYG